MAENALWTNRELMYELYVEEKNSMRAISRELECSDRTVSVWLDKHGIEKRSKRAAYDLRDGGVQHYWNAEKYEYVRNEHKHRTVACPVHKLVAIAYGADPYALFAGDAVTHHKNRHKRDNRPENLITMNNSEHARLHQSRD